MQLANAPGQLTLPFANAGQKNTIPVASQIGITPGGASYTDGFPPLTMQPISAGGVPPSGLDFNGILFALSAADVWYSAGAGFPFNAGFAVAIGGYPKGARVLKADGSGYWLSITDNNSNNPDTGGAGWTPDAGSNSVSSVYASAQQTLAVGSSKIIFDAVEFDAGSLWNAANHRFVAPFVGKYRMSGAVMLAAPGGQSLATQVWKNGALAKQCFQAPQVYDGNLTMPFDAVINLAVGDFLEAYMSVTQTPVLAGVVGSNQPYVFAQVEFLGT
jgi:hypothetical protein